MSALKLDCLVVERITVSSTHDIVFPLETESEPAKHIKIFKHSHEIVNSPLTQTGTLLKEEFGPAK